MSASIVSAAAHERSIKMEDRKRSLGGDHDAGTPPLKRQATLNGVSAKLEGDKEKDIESYQKDAILRQMREYKREKTIFESRVNELTKQAVYHDEHIRLIDAWFLQLLDEIKLKFNHLAPCAEPQSDLASLKSSLLTDQASIFSSHLKDRSASIQTAISAIFVRAPQASAEVTELQEKLSTLLASEKSHLIELQRITSDRDQLNARLENASYRYLVAEKKLDRAKSAIVSKMEQQATIKREDVKPAAKDASKTASPTPSDGPVDTAAMAANDAAKRESDAIAERRRLQIDQLEAENKKLSDQLTASQLATLVVSDDDYAKTALYTQFKSQHEDAIKRLNDLEATNIQLREEAQKLHSERTAFRNQLEEEARTATAEHESLLARMEADLSRVRGQRDDNAADLAVKKLARDGERLSADTAKELDLSRQSRMEALESEIARLRASPPELHDSTLESMTIDDLKAKVGTMQRTESMLSKELVSMEIAWKKSQSIAAKKVAEIASWEEQSARAIAEKGKADQKYFAAMKTKEAREGELRMAKQQNTKTSEIITQLRDAESTGRALSANLERQLAESRDALAVVTLQTRALQQKIGEANVVDENLKNEIVELKKVIGEKDSQVGAAASARRKVEADLDACKTRLEDAQKSVDTAKKRSVGKESGETDNWRRIAICPVCNSNLRNTALKLCGHVFCDVCVQNLISNRSRKCPSCARAFGTNDSMSIVLA